MKEDIKCCLFALGLGFVMGAIVVANSKKAQNVAKEVQTTAVDKIEDAKEGLTKIKEKIQDQIQENKKQSKKTK